MRAGLAAAVAAALTVSVAAKTHRAPGTKYLHVQQSARDVERQAARMLDEFQKLIEKDSAAFAPVIALRRATGRVDDAIVQDASRRQEVAALKPATEIPLRIARLATQVGELALTLLDIGFKPARGEAYTALSQAIAAVDGALMARNALTKQVFGS